MTTAQKDKVAEIRKALKPSGDNHKPELPEDTRTDLLPCPETKVSAKGYKTEYMAVSDTDLEFGLWFFDLFINSVPDDPYKGKSILTTKTGWNSALKTHYAEKHDGREIDPIKFTNTLAYYHVLSIRPVKGSVVLYPYKASNDSGMSERGDDALKKMNLS